jgi:hypothetical protein
VNAVQSAMRSKLRLEAFFVIGFPHDTLEDLKGSANYGTVLLSRDAGSLYEV